LEGFFPETPGPKRDSEKPRGPPEFGYPGKRVLGPFFRNNPVRIYTRDFPGIRQGLASLKRYWKPRVFREKGIPLEVQNLREMPQREWESRCPWGNNLPGWNRRRFQIYNWPALVLKRGKSYGGAYRIERCSASC